MVVGQGETWLTDLGSRSDLVQAFGDPSSSSNMMPRIAAEVGTVVCVLLTTVLKWADVIGNVPLSARSTGLEEYSVANVKLDL